MNNWIETELSSIIELTNGYAFKSKDFKDSGIPVIKIKNVKPQEIKLNVLSYVDKETIIGKEKWKINKGDILITMSGNRSDGSPDSWVGKVAQFNKEGEYYLNQRLSILKPKVDYVNSTFLAYQLSSWDYQLELINLSNSSGGQANISPEIVKQLKILLPTLLEQEQIAEILSSLDDKIELLHKNNKTFEQLAETLFRQWFVEEVKEEWNEVKLGSHIKGKQEMVYNQKKGKAIIPTRIYGGKCVENICQALARIVIGEQMLEVAKKLRVVMTVHDAVGAIAPEAEADKARAYVEQCMRIRPKWAAELPLNCESKMGASYGG